MSGRDELRDFLQANMHRIDGFERWTFQAPVDMADAILAAGYRKPQQVSTVEELVMLEPGVVLQGPDFHEETYKCTAPGTFHGIATPTEYRASELVGRGPFAIIHRSASHGND